MCHECGHGRRRNRPHTSRSSPLLQGVFAAARSRSDCSAVLVVFDDLEVALEVDNLLSLPFSLLEQVFGLLPGFFKDSLGFLFGEDAGNPCGYRTVGSSVGSNRIGRGRSFGENCSSASRIAAMAAVIGSSSTTSAWLMIKTFI